MIVFGDDKRDVRERAYKNKTDNRNKKNNTWRICASGKTEGYSNRTHSNGEDRIPLFCKL